MRRRRNASNPPIVGRGEHLVVWAADDGASALGFALDDPRSAFVLTGRWEVNEQGLVLVELSVTSRRLAPREPGGGLDALAAGPQAIPPAHIASTVFRSISVPELERRTRDALRRGAEDEAEMEAAAEWLRARGTDWPYASEIPRRSRALLERLKDEPFRPGRQGYPIGLYEWVAREYLVALQTGSRSILPMIAARATERLGRPVSVQNVRDWVRRARALKFLSEGLPGKAHADPGPALRNPPG